MKRRSLWIGFSILLLVVVFLWVLFSIQTHTPQEVSTESNEIDAIIALYPLEEQGGIREYYEAEMQKAKATGNDGFVARFQGTLQELLREDVDEPIPDDFREAVQYYEAEIQKEKEGDNSEQLISTLEYLRDMSLDLARSKEKRERESRERLARYYALSTPEEKLAYYEEELLEDEEALRLAKEKGDASEIRYAELMVKGTKQFIEIQKGRIAWLSKKPERDALLQRAEASSARLIDKYRHLLHTEVVDGVEQVVGVRTPDEIASSSSEKSEGRSFPADVPSPVPTVSDDVSSSPSVVENTPIPAVEGAMQPFVKAQTEFQSWRNDIDQDYVDVLVSRYMSPQELEQYFPTAQQRKSLTHKTERLQDEVVSKMRKIVSAIPDVTHEQKRTFARNILTQNFDSEFAESVLKQLDFDDN